MSMSKKHFIALADAVRPVLEDSSKYYVSHSETRDNMVEALADFCRSQNHRFNRDRWLSYLRGECGPNGGAK
jgi:hypothetical protein